MKARRGTNCIWLVDPRDGKELRRLPLPMRRINSTIYPPRRMASTLRRSTKARSAGRSDCNQGAAPVSMR